MIGDGNLCKSVKDLPNMLCGDFYYYCMKKVKPDSIDHIITDPPYPGKYLPLWSKLSEVANKVLKPSGFCITYVGTYYLDEVLDRMKEYDLKYYWEICMKLIGAHARVHPRSMYQGYRGILMFQKKPVKKHRFMTLDYIEETGGKDKELHQWQQAEGGFAQLLKMFTLPGQMILDPFGGSGTVPVVCMKNNRRCLCIEINEKDAFIIKGRLIKTFKDM